MKVDLFFMGCPNLYQNFHQHRYQSHNHNISHMAKLGHQIYSNVALFTFLKINENQQPGDMLK